jgi:branched-chain amino acid transport system substrate-binding protein
MRLASLAVALALLGLPSAGVAADPFEIYANLPITGQVAFIGSQTAKALTAIEGYVNAHGGINGRPIKIVVQDDQSNPQVAVQIVSQYVSKKPAIIFGGTSASLCNASAGVLKDDGPVLYCYTPGVHPPPGSWVYSSGYSAIDIFTAGIRYFRERGVTKIAIISTTDASGQEAGPSVAEILSKPENRGVTLTTNERFGVTDLSVVAQLERIKSSGAQMIITWVSGTPFGTVLRGLRDSGTNLPILSSQANMNYAQLRGYQSIWPNTTVYFPGVPALVPEAVPNRGVRRAIEEFNAAMRTQGIVQPDVAEAFAWDNMLIAVDAYKHLGVNATPAQMRDYINNVKGWQGIYGIVDYAKTPQRGMSADWCMVVRWDPAASRFVAVSKPGGSPTGQ